MPFLLSFTLIQIHSLLQFTLSGKGRYQVRKKTAFSSGGAWQNLWHVQCFVLKLIVTKEKIESQAIYLKWEVRHRGLSNICVSGKNGPVEVGRSRK